MVSVSTANTILWRISLCSEKEIIEKEYEIKLQTFTPSIYGDSQLTFREKDDVHIESDEGLHNRKIQEEIMKKRKAGGAVIVFFETEQHMKQWLESDYAVPDVSSVTTATDNVDHYIKHATRSGSVTLFSRIHGRGLDFTCHDKVSLRSLCQNIILCVFFI